MSRNVSSGDRVAIRSKVAAKYDKTAETEVITWFDKLLDIKLEPGTHKLEKQLRNGQHLVKLAQKIQSETPNCPEKAKKMILKFNTDTMPFKQMENIQTFLGFCENYGVQKTGLFHTKDLFEGRNLAQVLSCIQQLGSECQRNHFSGPCIGPKPLEKNVRDFSEEKLRAGLAIIGMQAGSGKSATQSGMHTGARAIVDPRIVVAKERPIAHPSENTEENDVVNGNETTSKKDTKLDAEESEDEDEHNHEHTEDDIDEKSRNQDLELNNSENVVNPDEIKDFVYDTTKPADEKIKERSWRKK